MTLTEYKDIQQGSDEWLDQRRGMVTASVLHHLITPTTVKVAANEGSRRLTALLVAERITGWTDPQYVSDDMLRGTDDEPRAVEVYSEHHSPVTTTGFMVLAEDGWELGYSPDGLVGDDGLIEVKSRRAKRQLQDVIADVAPLEHMAQMQAGLFVTGRRWCDYVSYCGGMPLWVKRVWPDPRWFAAIAEAVQTFETEAAQMTREYEGKVVGLPQTERLTYQEMVI